MRDERESLERNKWEERQWFDTSAKAKRLREPRFDREWGRSGTLSSSPYNHSLIITVFNAIGAVLWRTSLLLQTKFSRFEVVFPQCLNQVTLDIFSKRRKPIQDEELKTQRLTYKAIPSRRVLGDQRRRRIKVAIP